LANDWVARHAQHLPVAGLLPSLPVMAALEHRNQGSASLQLQALISRIRQEATAEELLDSLSAADTRTRRFIFQLLCQSGAMSRAAVQKVLLRHADPFIGLMCLHFAGTASLPLTAEVLNIAVKSKSAMLRAKALESWRLRGLAGFHALLHGHLLDCSPAIRQFARYWLQHAQPEFDAREYYASVLAGRASLRGAMAAFAGFHETGGLLPAVEYTHWLDHRSSAVRRLALKCFAASHPDSAKETVRHLVMGDFDPPLSRTAFDLVRHHSGWLSFEEIAALVVREGSILRRVRALSLLRRQNKWRQIPVLLQLLARDEPEILSAAQTALRDWQQRFNLTWNQPAPGEVEEARRWLAAAAPRLEKKERLNLQNLLDSVVTG